jgi:hypothetical protein
MADPIKATDPESVNVAPEPVRKFRVLHAAVSGVAPDPKNPGRTREHDYYTGTIVTDDQLGGNAAQYLVAGAIEMVD